MTEFRILGPLEVLDDEGNVVDLGGPRQRALLAALLVRANSVVSTDRLVDELWGESAPRTATTSLHNAVSQLRRLLGPDVLVTRAPGYVLRVDGSQLDAARFEQLVEAARSQGPEDRARSLAEALSLWRSDALEGLADEGGIAAEARRLDELRVATLEDRLDAEIELGRHAESIGELRALVARNPLRERLRGLLMLALYRSGRQAEALQAYHEARHALVEELGIEPGRELKELYTSIIRQERSLERAAAPSAADHFGDALKALLAGRLVPVLGPAVHASAGPNGVAAVPPGLAAAAEHLARAFDCPPDQALSRVSQYVSVTRGVGPLYDELHALFGRPYPPGPVHHALASLPPRLRERGLPQQLIVTTGYDHTVERAFAAVEEPLEVVSYIALGRDRGKFVHLASDGSARVIHEPNVDVGFTSDRTVLLKIHGGADESDARDLESFVVSEDDYIDFLADAPLSTLLPVGLAARLRRSHLLFLGYDLEDWSLRVFLRRLWGDERIAYRSWAVGSDQDALSVEYWRQRGVEAFDVPLEEYVAELAARVESAPSGTVVG